MPDAQADLDGSPTGERPHSARTEVSSTQVQSSRRVQNSPPPALPPALSSLARFLQSATVLGNEVAFWRSQSRISELRQASSELHSILLNPHVFALPEPNRSTVLAALDELSESVARLKQAVPFRNRVGAIRRSLMPAYQEIFILHQLLLAVTCRLRMRSAPGEAAPRPGSLMDLDSKRELRESLRSVLTFWRREEWHVYDYL